MKAVESGAKPGKGNFGTSLHPLQAPWGYSWARAKVSGNPSTEQSAAKTRSQVEAGLGWGFGGRGPSSSAYWAPDLPEPVSWGWKIFLSCYMRKNTAIPVLTGLPQARGYHRPRRLVKEEAELHLLCRCPAARIKRSLNFKVISKQSPFISQRSTFLFLFGTSQWGPLMGSAYCIALKHLVTDVFWDPERQPFAALPPGRRRRGLGIWRRELCSLRS